MNPSPQHTDIYSQAVPDVDSIRRTFLRMAICELRFPVLLELADKAPVELQKILRKDFPIFERNWDVSIDAGAPGPIYEPRYLFHTRGKDTTFLVKQDAVVLETKAYHRFSDFSARLRSALVGLKGTLDIPFFTRAGLRFVNAFPIQDRLPPGWINPDLSRTLEKDDFARVFGYWGEIRGEAGADILFTLRHGLEQPNNESYVLDLDHSRTNVDVEDLDTTLAELRAAANKLFFWCAGPEALAHMRGTDKEE